MVPEGKPGERIAMTNDERIEHLERAIQDARILLEEREKILRNYRISQSQFELGDDVFVEGLEISGRVVGHEIYLREFVLPLVATRKKNGEFSERTVPVWRLYGKKITKV
jgi:hypothetical protein